jgi:hypothetical protein
VGCTMLVAATAATADAAHSLLRIAKGGAPASSASKPNRTRIAWATRLQQSHLMHTPKLAMQLIISESS